MNDEYDVDDFAPWLVVFITLAGIFLRLFLLDTKGMWLDETFSVWMASHSIGEILQWIVKIDQHPPLYYFLLHYWIELNGNTPYDARLLSVLFGAGAIPMIYLIGKRLSGAMVGLAAAAILAFSPFHIYYAQETRMYTLLMFNAAVAIYSLVWLLTDPRSIRPVGSQFREYLQAWRISGQVEPGRDDELGNNDEPRVLTGWKAWISRHHWSPIRTIETDLAWVAFIVFTDATLYSHNTAVLFLLAANIFVLGLILFQRIKKSGALPAIQAPSLMNWVKAQVGIFILWLPWIIPFIKQSREVYQRFWIPVPTWDSVLQVLKSFLNASGPLPANLAVVIWVLYGLVLCLGLFHYRKEIPQFLLLVALFAIPLLGELIVSIWRPIFWDRTLIWITIPLFLVLAAGFVQLKFRLVILLVLGSLCTINLFSAGDYYRFYQKEDWSTAAGDVAGFAEKDDLVLFNSNIVEIPFDYYFQPYETRQYIQVQKHGVPQDLFESGILEPVMTANDIPGLISLISGHNRVWLVYSHDSFTDPMGLIPQTLSSHKKLIRTDDFYGGQVQLYVNP
jgi:mannosyltransferase